MKEIGDKREKTNKKVMILIVNERADVERGRNFVHGKVSLASGHLEIYCLFLIFFWRSDRALDRSGIDRDGLD